jgi:DNA replication regulator SLD3
MALHALQTTTMLPLAFPPLSEHLGPPPRYDSTPKPRLPSKRKRDTICGLEGFNQPFTIKPCPATPYDKPYAFKPVRIIGRSQLPLAFLDTSTEDNFASNRLFSANIAILENHHEFQAKQNVAPKVLIARHESRRTLYAVERVQARVYSLCKLAVWLKEKDVTELWDPENLAAYPQLPQLEDATSAQGEWWKHAMVDTQPAERPTKRVRLSILRKPKPEPVTEIREAHVVLENSDVQPKPLSTEIDTQLMQAPIPLTPQEQLESLVEQYLEAIYLSKTSLAYFAKGPIARIRNAFTSPEEGAPQTYELVSFMRAMLLSHKSEEKKYGEKLPEVIKALPPGCYSDDDDELKKPKKSKRKVKLSGAGMYPQEANVVKKWWLGEMPNGDTFGEETTDQRIKRRLADLRVREALGQMILMLEIVSLEALSTYKKAPEDVGTTEETQAQEGSQPKPKKRKKKIDDINLLLDLLLDKLCIWQSVEQAGVLDFDAPMSKHGGGASDRLQSFCVEVIVPFYMNRLPEQARMVSKKLGGPATSSPPKRKAMKPPATSRKSGDSNEPESKKPRRSLTRVATDTTGQSIKRRNTSLARSTTDSALINGIKREGSEIRLSAIPLQRSPSQAAKRSMSQMRILKGREIDLETTSAAAAAKIRQKKRVEDDLKDAITALKKPNRGLAAGNYANDVEQRGLGLTNKSRKPTSTVRNLTKDVQVSATPRAARRMNNTMIQQTPMHHRNPFTGPRQTDAPPSSDFCIPSSAPRPASSIVPATVQRSATTRRFEEPSISETPSRPAISKSFLSQSTTNRTLFVTPRKHRAPSPDSPAQVDATPTKMIASSPPDIVNTRTKPRLLFATPLKPAAQAPVPDVVVPSISTAAAKDGDEPSIFDALGWNDDDDFV